jgi:transketolase
MSDRAATATVIRPRADRTPGLTLREAFAGAVAELATTDGRIVMLDAEVGNSTRADIFEEAHPDRYLPVGIAEQNMLGMAAGLAAAGFIPFPVTFAVFVAKRSLDQIRVLIAQPRLPVKIAVSYTGLMSGMAGKTHQPVEEVTVMRAMPNMTVVNPADAVEMQQAVRAVVAYDGPVYLMVYREALPTLFTADYRFELGRAITLRDGRDLALISTGPQSGRVLEAAEILAGEGIDARVIHVPTIKPLDDDLILAAARETGFVVTIEEHSILGALGGAVAELLSEQLPTRMRRIGLRDEFGASGSNDALLEKFGLSPRRVADQVVAYLAELGI